MSSKSLTNLLKNESARLQTAQVNENVEFLRKANEEDIVLGTTKYADAVIDALQNLSIYRESYGNYKTRTYNELGIDPYVGSSKYDKNANNLYNLQHIADIRADEQSTGLKLFNGFIGALSNAAVTAVTPIIAPIGSIYDLATKHKFTFLNSSVMNQFQNFNEWVGQSLAPIYKHEWEQDETLNPFKRMKTAGFWAEDFIKNLGFTVGALYGGKLISMGTASLFWNANTKKAAKMLAKQLGSAEDLNAITTAIRNTENLDQKAIEISNILAKKAKVKSIVSQATGIVSGALIEAHTEALQARRNMVDEGMRHIMENYNPKSQLVRMEYENAIKNKDIPEDMTFMEFMFKRRTELENALNNRADQTMRAIYAAETVLLSISNGVLWRNFFDVSVNKSSLLLDRSIRRFITKPKTALGIQDVKYRRNELSRIITWFDSFLGEGLEEMFQSGISTAFENYYGSLLNDDYRRKKLTLNPKYSNAILKLFENTGFLKQFLSPQSLTEGIIGGITGIVGLPSKTMSRAQRQAQNISVFNPKAWTMQGGMWDAYRKNRDNTKQAKEVIANIQKVFKDGQTPRQIVNDVVEIIAASHTEIGGHILNDKKEILDSRRDQFLKLLNIYEQFGMLGDIENYFKTLIDFNNIDENERNAILTNVFDLYDSKGGNSPSDSDVYEISKKIIETAQKQLKLLTTYKKISENLIQIANNSSNGLLTTVEKNMAASIVKEGLVRIEDIKNRKSDIFNRLLDNDEELLQNLMPSTELTEQNILNWLKDKFSDELKQMLSLPIAANEGELSATTIKQDIILDLQKIFSAFGIEDITRQLSIANDMIDLYLLNEDLNRQSKKVSKSWVSILTDIKNLEEEIAEENKNADGKKIIDIIGTLNNKFDTLLSVKARSINQTETLKEIIPLLDQLKEEDQDKHDEYIRLVLNGDNSRAYHFIWQYLNNNKKIKYLQMDTNLFPYSNTENYKNILETAPADLDNELDKIINNPNLDPLERKAWKDWKARMSSYEWYQMQPKLLKRFNSGSSKRTSDDTTKIPVEKKSDSNNKQSKGNENKNREPYLFVTTVADDSIKLSEEDAKRITDQAKAVFTGLYKDPKDEIEFKINKDNTYTVSYFSRQEPGKKNIKMTYTYDFKHNNVKVILTYKKKTIIDTNVKFTDLWSASSRRKKIDLSNDESNIFKLGCNIGNDHWTRMNRPKSGPRKVEVSDDFIKKLDEICEIAKNTDDDIQMKIITSIFPTQPLIADGTIYRGIVIPNSLAEQSKNVNAAERLDKFVEKIIAIYKKNMPNITEEIGDVESDNDTEDIDKNTSTVTKIISGAQTGVDMIGLEVARDLNIETGGTAPPHFKRESGYDEYTVDDLKDFGVEEISEELQNGKTGFEFYFPRNEQNIINSDGTVYFHTGTSKGIKSNKSFAKKHKKEIIVNPTAKELREWLDKHNIKTLNVAGNRGSVLKDNSDFTKRVEKILKDALTGNFEKSKSEPQKKNKKPEYVSTEIEYSEDEIKQLELDQESLDSNLNDGESFDSVVNGLLAMNKIQDDDSDIQNLGYEYDSETGELSFKTDDFTSKSLIHAKGAFPVGYEFTFHYKDESPRLRVTQVDNHGKILNAENDEFELYLNKYNVYYLKHKRESSSTSKEQYIAETQASLIPISEVNYAFLETHKGHLDVRYLEVWKAHPTVYEQLTDLFQEVFENINTGVVKEGDKITFTTYPLDVNKLSNDDLKWLQKNLKGFKFHQNPIILVANVMVKGKLTPIGYVFPETHGYKSELWKAVINSYREIENKFAINLKVDKLSNAHERVVTTNDPDDMIKSKDYSYEDLLFVLRTNNSLHPNVSNEDITFSDEEVDRMYGDVLSAGNWNMQPGSLYLIVKNSSGEVIPEDTSAPNLSVKCSVVQNKTAFLKVLKDYSVLTDILNKPVAEIEESDLTSVTHKLNNIFRFKNLNYEFFVSKLKNDRIRFTIYDSSKEDIESVLTTLSETPAGLFIDLATVISNDDSNIDELSEQLAQLIVKFDGMIQLTENSFHNPSKEDVKTMAGIDLKYLYENDLLIIPISHNRTMNTNVISDFKYSGKQSSTSSKSDETRNEDRLNITPAEKSVYEKKPNKTNKNKEKTTSVLENYELKTYWGDHILELYEKEDGVILHLPDYKSGIDFIQDNISVIQEELENLGILVNVDNELTTRKPINVYYMSKTTKTVTLSKKSDQYVTLLLNTISESENENENENENIPQKVTVEQVDDLKKTVIDKIISLYNIYENSDENTPINSDENALLDFNEIKNEIESTDTEKVDPEKIDVFNQLKSGINAIASQKTRLMQSFLNCLK